MPGGIISYSQPTSRDVQRSAAEISWSTSGWALPDDAGTTTTGDSKNGSKTTISYSDLSYLWRFSPGDGMGFGESISFIYGGLIAGSRVALSASVSVSCEKTVTVISWTTTKDDDDNEITTTSDPQETTTIVDIGTASNSVIVYTKPNSWSWSSVDRGSIIQETLYASEWNDLIEQCRKYRQWEQQSSVFINVPTVQSGDLITAELYNSMAAACGINTRVTGGRAGTVISASLFISLANAVS